DRSRPSKRTHAACTARRQAVQPWLNRESVRSGGAMFGLPRRSDGSPEQQAEAFDYLRDVLPLVDKLEEEFKSWMDIATDDSLTLTLDRDPDGQHASVYLWRVGQTAVDFTQREPPRAARRFHEAQALCLEARGAAADVYRDAATLSPLKDPGGRIAEANRRLAEARRQRTRAENEQKQIEARLK